MRLKRNLSRCLSSLKFVFSDLPDVKGIAYDVAVWFNCVSGTNASAEYAKRKFPGVRLGQILVNPHSGGHVL